MRNLKKILALVLALVMSLSLMATAGAASFPDVADDNAYKTAIEVLNGVKVLKGYDEGARFEPKGSINRGEAAAVIYRIATGDVTDTQSDIYTAWNGAGKLSDVSGWCAGYVNYCCNAGYIKGYPNGTFQYQNNVTGYEILAMVMRALGYGKNGEFEGSQWAITTASLAQTLGITKNIKEDLGAPATREMVAEIVFRAIFCETQKPNALYRYEGTGTNLARENLNLEEVEGVVIANEYAHLEDNNTLKDGKTLVRDEKTDKSYTIDYGTTLDDIGESRLIYIQNKNTVLSLADSGKNVKDETTDKAKLSDVLSNAGITENSETESYVNFGQTLNWHSDWKIRYELSFNTLLEVNDNPTDAQINGVLGWIENNSGFVLPEYPNASCYTRVVYEDDNNVKYVGVVYTESFRIDEAIGASHQNNIEEIFNIADRKADAVSEYYVTGEVYVGTTSMKDISDTKSFKQFLEDYIRENDVADVSANERGNWLKVIDNDADGKADYILKVIYTFAQVDRVKDEKVTLDVKDHNLIGGISCPNDVINELTDETVVPAETLEEGDVVYYAIIDGKAQTYKAATETATIEKVNRNDRTATSTEGTEWTESGVCEHIEDEAYESGVGNLYGKVTYDLFFDRGGYLAAFVRSDRADDLRLVLDGWYNETKGGAEYAVKVYNKEDSKVETIDITTNGDLFISGDVVNDGDKVQNNDWGALKYLGGTTNTTGALDNITAHKHVAKVGDADIPYAGAALNGANCVCTWPAGDPALSEVSNNTVKTTVASISADGTILPVESRYVGTRNPLAMIDMGLTVPTNAYSTGRIYSTNNNSNTAYNIPGVGTVEVRALSSTVYYIVSPDGVEEVITSYANAPDPDDLSIEDVYVVGTRRSADTDKGTEYYTANIVVIEVTEYDGGYEPVFVVDDEFSDSDVNYRNVRVIREDGTDEVIKVWTGRHRILGYDPTNLGNGEKLTPGLYKMQLHSGDIYKLTPMSANDIRDKNFITGQVKYEEGTTPEDYVVIHPWYNGEDDPRYGADETLEFAQKDGELYQLRYGTGNTAGYNETEPTLALEGYKQVFKGAVEGVRHGDPDEDLREFDGYKDNHRYFYNDLLIHYNSKNEVVWAVSFANVYEKSNGRDGWDYAQWIVETVQPNPASKGTQVTVESKNPAGEKFTVKDAEGTALVTKGNSFYTKTKDGLTITIEAPYGYKFDSTVAKIAPADIDNATQWGNTTYTNGDKTATITLNDIEKGARIALTLTTDGDAKTTVTVTSTDVVITESDGNVAPGTKLNNFKVKLAKKGGDLASNETIVIDKITYGADELKAKDYSFENNVVTFWGAVDEIIDQNIEITAHIVKRETYTVKVNIGNRSTLALDANDLGQIEIKDYKAVGEDNKGTATVNAEATDAANGIYAYDVTIGYDLELTVTTTGKTLFVIGDVATPKASGETVMKWTIPYVEEAAVQNILAYDKEDADKLGADLGMKDVPKDKATAAQTKAEALKAPVTLTVDKGFEFAANADSKSKVETSDAGKGVTLVKVTAENGAIAYYAFKVVESAGKPIVNPTPDVKGDAATTTPDEEEIKTAISNVGKDKTVTINAASDNENVKSSTVTLTSEVVDALTEKVSEDPDAAAKVNSVDIKTDNGNVTLPTSAIEKAVEGKDTVESVDVVVKEADTSEVEVPVDAAVVDVTVQVNGEEVTLEGLEESISITIPAPAGKQEGDKVAVYYLKDGKLEAVTKDDTPVTAAVDKDGMITFETDHLTIFAAMNPAATVTLSRAALHDTRLNNDETKKDGVADEALNIEGYTLTEGKDGTLTVKHTGLKKHFNAADPAKEGSWVGFQVALDPAEGEPKWTKVTYSWKGRAEKTSELENLGEDTEGIAFYYDCGADGTAYANGDTVVVTFETADGLQSATLTYKVSFNVTIAADKPAQPPVENAEETV